MNKKGFTLIELLAVIVILAIIALIATPIILGIINEARDSAKVRSAELVYTGVEYGYVTAMYKSAGGVSISNPTLSNIKDHMKFDNVKEENIKLEGTGDTEKLTITTDDGVTCEVSKVTEGYQVKCGSYLTKVIPTDETTNVEIISGESTEVIPSGKKGIIKIIYYNPTEGNTCTKSDYETNLTNYSNNNIPTGLKSGCMKWYAYKKSKNKYTMILDHNTTAKVYYNSTNSNSEQKEIATELSNLNNSWKVTARLITGQEVADIVGNTSWVASATDNFNFDINNPTTKNSNAYSWLIDYTYGCEAHGCNIQDNRTYGYWTGTPYSSNSNNVWIVSSYGYLFNGGANYPCSALRPVIEIL